MLHIAGLREAIAGGGDPDEATPVLTRLGQQINQPEIRNYRTDDALDEPGREEFLRRVAVQFGGLSDLMDKYPLPGLAAASEVYPSPGLLGTSAASGLNATGESDDQNYYTFRDDWRRTGKRTCATIMEMLDQRCWRGTLALKEPTEYEFECRC